jgi:hypothetical protein
MIGVEWVTVMDVLNLNLLINHHHCIRKTILSKDGLSAYINIILFYVMFYDSGRQPFWIRGPHSQIKKNSQARQNKNLIFLSYLL